MTERSLIARQRASGRAVEQTTGTGKAAGERAYPFSSLKSLPVLGLTR